MPCIAWHWVHFYRCFYQYLVKQVQKVCHARFKAIYWYVLIRILLDVPRQNRGCNHSIYDFVKLTLWKRYFYLIRLHRSKAVYSICHDFRDSWICMVILTIQLLGWCWLGGVPFHYTLSVVSVPRVFGSGPFPPLGDISKIALVESMF